MQPSDCGAGALAVLYLDAWCLAVHKPPGLLMHRSTLGRDRSTLLRQLRGEFGQPVYPAHRLDRATSGVVLFARDPETAARLGLAFRSGRIEKTYRAVVRGYTRDWGVVDHPLEVRGERRPAVTRYRTLATVELPFRVGRYATARYALVEVSPLTGRHHQIRRHFAHIAHPVIGDTVHGDGRHNRLFRERFGLHRLLLCATGLTFPHPRSGAPVTVEALREARVAALCRRFGWPEV